MLTEEAVKRVESGKQQADTADRTIREMTDSIQQSVQAFQQIVAGSSQQQIGCTLAVQGRRDSAQRSHQPRARTTPPAKDTRIPSLLAQQPTSAVLRHPLAD